MDQQSYHQERPRKRQRVSRACDPCRTRKTACDGRRPICLACTSRSAEDECRWTFVPKRETDKWESNPAQATAFSYHSGDYSKPLKSTPHDTAAVKANAYGPGSVDSKPYGGAPVKATTSEAAIAKADADGPAKQSQRFPQSLHHSDANGTPLEAAFSSAPSDGLAIFPGSSDQATYGPSSTVAFLRHVLAKGSRPASGAETPNGSPRIPRSTTQRLSAPTRLAVSQQVDLPSRENADDFLACYWEFVHPIFPLLHKTSFIDLYERFWASDKDAKSFSYDLEESVFPLTLNLVFALGCQFSHLVPSSQKSSMADEFYQRMIEMIIVRGVSIMDSMSIATVQMLALTGVYLQSTQYASRCWNSIGLAVRSAQSLGLHSESRGPRVSSQLKREMRRRIWHTLVSLDRLLSMTFGRPAMVTGRNEVPLPLLIDDEYLSSSHEGEQPSDIPSRFGGFVFSCKLFDLLDLVLNFLSSSGLQITTHTKDLGSFGEMLSQVLEINRRLDAYSESIPPYLLKAEISSPFTGGDETHIQLQQRVLYCRLMLVRLLLLRPLLLMSSRLQGTSSLRTLDGTAQSSMDMELVKSSCNLCLTTAYKLVDAVYFHLNTLYRSSGWHAVYFTFSAAIVLIASLKCPLVDLSTGDEKFEACWSRSMEVFEHYSDQIRSAAHATLVLKSIRTQIDPGNDVGTRGSEHHRNVSETKLSEASAGWSSQDMPWPDFDLYGFDPFNLNSMSDAWFGQQLTNLDWLELPEHLPEL